MGKLMVLRSDHPDWVKVVCPYNDEWIDTFKATIPGAARRPVYDPLSEKKFAYWLVLASYLNELATLFEAHFPGEDIESDIEATENTRDSGGNPFVLVFSTCPQGKRRDLYIALIKIFHPDAGGSEAAAALLNQAYRQENKP